MRVLVVAAVLVVACDGQMSGGDRAHDAGSIACCFELHCAPGQECFDCTCRDSDCCASLTCLEEVQVCISCACVSSDDRPDGSIGGGPDEDDDGYGADVDCDEDDDAVHPDASELCNQRDDDCDVSIDEDTCSGLHCCLDGCAECCGDAHCDDGDGCTADRCELGFCRSEAPEACTDCCVSLCEHVQPMGCASVMQGDCTEFCSAIAGVEDEAGCTDLRVAFESCLSTCDDPCAGGCDEQGEALGDCGLEYCLDHLANRDCQTLAAAFGR